MPSAWTALLRQRRPYLLLFLFALGFRLVYLVDQERHNPLFDVQTVDASVYSHWADEIARGQWDWPDLRNYLPIYPCFLAICKWFFYGDNPWSVKLVQSLLSSVACVLLAAVTARAFDKRAGIAAGLLFATNWLFVVYDGERYSEMLCLTCLCGCLYCLLCVAPGWARSVGAGLTCAFACACRPNLLPVIPLAIGWIFLKERPLSRKWIHSAVALAAVALIFVPVLLHNHRVSGRWSLRAQQYWNLYAALEPAFGGLHPAAGIPFEKYMLKPTLAGKDADLYWKERSFALLREKPWAALKNYLFDRAAIFVDGTEWSQEFDVYAFRQCSWWLSLPWPGFGWILPLAGAGLVGVGLRWRRGSPLDAEAVSRQRFLLSFLLIVAAFTFAGKVTGRYRIPVTLLLTPFAGAGAAWLLFDSAKRPVLFAAFLAGGALSWPDWPDLRDRQTALHYHNIALKLIGLGDLEGAADAFRQETERQPWNADSPCELAVIRLRQHRLPEAMEAVSEAVRREPDFWRAWNLKGTIAIEQKKYDEALAALDRSLAINPNQPEPWMQKKTIYATLDRWDDEKKAFQNAIIQAAGPGFTIEYALRLEEKQLYLDSVRLLRAFANDREPRFDRARACLLAGYIAAIDLHQLDQAHALWERAAGEFRDVPFFADQASFLVGSISEEEYDRRVKALGSESAASFFDFNRGFAALVGKDYAKAETAFQQCLARRHLTTGSPLPASVPEKWAWTLLKARKR